MQRGTAAGVAQRSMSIWWRMNRGGESELVEGVLSRLWQMALFPTQKPFSLFPTENPNSVQESGCDCMISRRVDGGR